MWRRLLLLGPLQLRLHRRRLIEQEQLTTCHTADGPGRKAECALWTEVIERRAASLASRR